MTTNDIDAIRQRANRSTEGPWSLIGSQDGDRQILTVIAEGQGDHLDYAVVAEVSMDPGDDIDDWRNDAEFIAAARTLVPALCDEVEQLRAALTESRKQAATNADEVGRLTAENARLLALVAKVEEIGRALDQTDEKNVRLGRLNEQYHGYGARLLYAVGDVRAAGVAL